VIGDYQERVDALEVLLGHRAADLVVVDGRVVDVWSGSVRPGGVSVTGSTIVAAGDVEDHIGPATTVIDAQGAYLTPGLIETHMHLYESNLAPTELARILLAHGTTALPEAMYGGGQIRGLEAVRFFLDELRRTPITVLAQVPILGYLQNLELGLPGAPNSLGGDELRTAQAWDDVVGLEEPPFIPMAEKDPVVRDLMERTLRAGQVVMGHGAGLTPTEVSAYAAMGVTADHEAVTAQEALDRIAAGQMVSMRESCVARNQVELQRAITEHGADPQHFMFCADVLDPLEAHEIGHIDQSVRLAVQGGVDPVAAVQMATVNAARYYRVDHALGSLAPGRQADVLIVEDLEAFRVRSVVAKGREVVRDGAVVAALPRPLYPAFLKDTVRLAAPATAATFALPAEAGADGRAEVRVIGGDNLVSDERRARLAVVDGAVAADPDQDVVKLAMLDRYGAPDPASIGFLQGYGLKRGALGTTYNPMYHNVLVAGVDDDAMARAANVLAEIGGGFVAVDGDEVVAVPLALCGLMSDAPAEEFLDGLRKVYAKARDLGCTMESPFHNLAFTAVCGELPFLKLAHDGLFDVQRRVRLPTVVDLAPDPTPPTTTTTGAPA
jgi:adenine deaminase